MSNPEVETPSLTRSCNEALILAALTREARHGYQIALDLEERSGEFFSFKHGTLYPILHKLEQDGLIEGVWSNEGPRGKRKSYALTEAGRSFAAAQRESWRRFIEHFQGAIEEVQP